MLLCRSLSKVSEMPSTDLAFARLIDRLHGIQEELLFIAMPRRTHLQSDTLRRLELAAQLGKLLVGGGVALEEFLLAVTELLGEWLEVLVEEDDLVGCEFEELWIGIVVVESCEVGVVEDEEFLGPGGAAWCVGGLLSVGALLCGSVSELGLLGSQSGSVLVRATCVGERVSKWVGERVKGK